MTFRYTIEREIAGGEPIRFLMILPSGEFAWSQARHDFAIFSRRQSAENFRRNSMGSLANGATVVQHSVH